MSKSITLKTKVLNSDEVVLTDSSALSPREKKLFGLTKKRKHKSSENRMNTMHLRWM